MGDESESEAPTSVAERVEVIEERIVPPPQAPEGARSRRMRTKRTGDRKTFVLSESNSSHEEKDGGKEEAVLFVMDEMETSGKVGLCEDFNSCRCEIPSATKPQ